MAKRTRGRLTREPAAAPTSQRVQRTRTPRRTARRTSEQPLFDRYRSWIIGGIALVGVLIIGYLFFQGATGAAYACRTLLTPGPSEPVPTPRPATPTPTLTATPATTESPSPGATGSPAPTSGESPSPSPTGAGSPSPTGAGSPSPTAGASPSPTGSPAASPSPSPSPEPSPTARLGFPVSDLGEEHVLDPGTTITYDYCPPASGEHYNIANVAPMLPAVYPPAQERSPGFWVHNLEHGYVVLAYRCPSGQLGVGECITEAEFEELKTFYEQAPPPPASSCATKVIVVRFDEMTTDFGLLAWDRALLMDDFDIDKATTFAEQWMEHVALAERLVC